MSNPNYNQHFPPGLGTDVKRPTDILSGGAVRQMQGLVAELQRMIAAGAPHEQVQNFISQNLSGMQGMMESAIAYANGGGMCPITYDQACGPESNREWRRPVVEETRVMPAGATNTINTASATALVNFVLGLIFPTTASRRFLEPNANFDNARAKTFNRGLIALAADWKISVTAPAYTNATGATVVTKFIDVEERLKEALGLCVLGVFKSSSDEPQVDYTSIEFYGKEGKQLPDSLARSSLWRDENAHIRVLNPVGVGPLNSTTGGTGWKEVTLAASSGTYTVDAALKVTGLFVDPGILKGYFAAGK